MRFPARNVLTIAVFAVASCGGGDDYGSTSRDGVLFKGQDPVWMGSVMVERRNGRYYMDGDEMQRLRHKNMPGGGISLAMKDRIGMPNMYYLVRSRGRLDIYVNCEFGPCTFKRSIRAR